jgi:hypothetical protein
VGCRLGASWRVDPSDALLKRLRTLLGADAAVEVVYRRSLTGGGPSPPLLRPMPAPAAVDDAAVDAVQEWSAAEQPFYAEA